MDQLNRLAEYGVTDRAALDGVLDSQWAGVLSTVVDGEPLAVPMLYARDGDRCSCTARPARERCARSRPARRRS